MLFSEDSLATWHKILPTLHSLHLPKLSTEIEKYESRNTAITSEQLDKAYEILNYATPSLRDLSLSARSYEEVAGRMFAGNRDNLAQDRIFHKLLSPLGFECLRTLSLRGPTFDIPDLGTFLLSHTATLRTLPIIDTHCRGRYSVFYTASVS